MWKNKHLVTAMLVAPVLAVIAWFAVDYFVAERPHAAQAGSAYPLLAKSNCRYHSGQCDLENADFELTLRPGEITSSHFELDMESRYPLQQARVALVVNGDEELPAQLVSKGEAALQWSATVPRPTTEDSLLRIAVVAQQATYYAEIPVVFLNL